MDGRKFIVQVKSLKKAQNLPPQWLFKNAQGVLASHLAVKIKPKNQFLKVVNRSKSWKSLPVYLVVNYRYLFIYTKKESGFVVNVRASGKVNKHEEIEKEKPFHGQIMIPSKQYELELDFEDSEAYHPWAKLLEAMVHPQTDLEWLRNEGLKLAGYASTAKEQVIAEKVDPPVGQKKDSDWVEVLRYPTDNDLNKTVFQETILQDDDLDAGSEVFEEEEPDFSFDGTDGNEEELSAAPFLNRTPSTRSSNRAVLARTPSTRRSPSRAPSLRSEAPDESLLDDEIYRRNISLILSRVSPRSTVADSRAFRSPSISRTPSTRRSPSRAPSLRSEARIPANPFSLQNESFSESNEDRGVLYAHASQSPARTPSRAPTPAISRAPTPRRAPTPSPARTPSRAPTPRRAAAAAPSEVPESFASRGDDPTRTSGRPTKKPARY